MAFPRPTQVTPGTDEGDMDSLYNEEAPEEKGDNETVDQEEQDETGETTVVPLSVLQGESEKPPKEGDTVKMKVVKVSGDQAVITCNEDYNKGEDTERNEKGEDYGEELDRMSADNEGLGE